MVADVADLKLVGSSGREPDPVVPHHKVLPR